jgi:predicted P-loop ATPase
MSKKKITPEKAAEIEAAVADIIDATPPPPDEVEVTDLVVIPRERIKWADTTVGGAPKNTMANSTQAIRALGLECKHDIFRDRRTVNGSNLQSFVGDLTDPITRKIRELSRDRFGLDAGSEATYDAMMRACEENRFHPVRDKFDSLVWDGQSRIKTWMTDYLGVVGTPLTRAQGHIVLAAIVKRTFEPGCKFDYVLVLEGPEGGMKSSACRVLANGSPFSNEYFSDSTILNTDERKQQELTAGVVVYELAELAGMRKADQHAVKNFVTKQEERARAAYAKFNQSQPRSPVFIGTFNTTADLQLIEYLNPGDQRRWWPVLVGQININGLMEVRDQLFAEAMVEYNMFGGIKLFLSDELEASARDIAKSREKVDPLSETYSTLAADIKHMALKPSSYTVDGKAVKREVRKDEVGLFKVGEEAAPFAMRWANGDLWVSSKYVGELAPAGRKSDGNGLAAAMRRHKWVDVNDRCTGSARRGWRLDAPSIDDLM